MSFCKFCHDACLNIRVRPFSLGRFLLHEHNLTEPDRVMSGLQLLSSTSRTVLEELEAIRFLVH